jgi:hypothetical protein
MEDQASLLKAWRQSARNGWRLALVVGAFPWLLSYGVDLLYRQNATLLETVLLVLLSVLASTLAVIALSFSYQDLRASQPAK